MRARESGEARRVKDNPLASINVVIYIDVKREMCVFLRERERIICVYVCVFQLFGIP